MFLKRLFLSLFAGKPDIPPAIPTSAPVIHEPVAATFSGDPWVQFMLHGSKPHGHSLADILDFNRGAFDTHHDFVQWLFPNREASPVNPLAPVLTDFHIRAYGAIPELRDGVDQASGKFLSFLGLREVATGIEQTDDFAQGARYWLRPMDHNHRRISRYLSFHCELGRKDRAVALLGYLEGALAGAGLSKIDALPYWRAIVHGAVTPA